MSTENEHFIKIATLNNQDKRSELNKYLGSLELESNTMLANFAITAFKITKENVRENMQLAEDLAELEYRGFRESLRGVMLEELLVEVRKELE